MYDTPKIGFRLASHDSKKQLEFVGGNLIWHCRFNDKDHFSIKVKIQFLLDVLVTGSRFRFQYGDKGCSLNINRGDVQ